MAHMVWENVALFKEGGKTPQCYSETQTEQNMKCGAGVIYMARKYNEIVMACNVNRIFIT